MYCVCMCCYSFSLFPSADSASLLTLFLVEAFTCSFVHKLIGREQCGNKKKHTQKKGKENKENVVESASVNEMGGSTVKPGISLPLTVAQSVTKKRA